MGEKIDKQEMQQRALKMQIIEQQVNQVQKQLRNFENQLMDLDVTKQSLEELKKSKLDSETLSMLSPGIFVKTKLAENKDVIINVGGNVAVKKNVEDAKKLIEDQIGEVKKIQAQLMGDLQKLDGAILKISK